MSQSAKFVDVTKSYLPIDPKVFPESMHGTGKEDSPETRIPVVAYDGHNFLPTAYGYRSYFGTLGKGNYDALLARVDHIFTFQTSSYRNFLVALTESGIWIKDAGTTGAWTQVVAQAVPVNPLEHYDWTYAIISNVLYAYKQGTGQYYTIKSLAIAPYYVIAPVVPSFLNMAAQQGIFRAGGRLGFWDSADSVAWSSGDDAQDFTPSLETGAGNAIFSDINGRITMIQGAGGGFIIYATRSIVNITDNQEATFQWEPKVILSNTGVAYKEEVCVAIPDTLQFAYTNTGIYKIEGIKGEVIVPEVYDFLKKAQKPIYPRILEGRFLFFQILDQGFFNGLAQFSDETVDSVAYFFPGSHTIGQGVDAITINPNQFCSVTQGVEDADYSDMQPGGVGGPPAIVDKKPGTKARPRWKCWISNNSVLDPSALTFGQVPCAVVDPNGVAIDLCPIGTSGRLDAMTQTSANKQGLLGSDVYVDGIWTIERFISVQTAIWDKQKANQQALIDKILNRAGTGQKLTEVGSCSVVPVSRTECPIGRYVKEYSEPQFGYGKCSFWLTRYALSAIDISAVSSYTITCELVPAHSINPTWTLWSPNFAGPFTQASASAACAIGSIPANIYPDTYNGQLRQTSCCNAPVGVCAAGSQAYRNPSCPVNYTLVDHYIDTGTTPAMARGSGYWSECTRADYYKKTEILYAYNTGREAAIAPTPETAYCEIIGWDYTKNDNTAGYVAATACTFKPEFPTPSLTSFFLAPPDDMQSTNYPLADNDGSMCSVPFLPVTLPGSPGTDITWPSSTVSFPPGNFLLQQGSIAPVYPNFEGSFVYDLHLKKWGVQKGTYKRLLDYQPLNDFSGGGIPYNRFGILGGVFKSNGFVYAFDAFPTDSVIKYGKIGYSRLGVTSSEEVKVHFATLCSGTVRLESSINGRVLESGWYKEVVYDNVPDATLYGGPPGRWFNVCISGIYDIQYLEYRGFVQGRR